MAFSIRYLKNIYSVQRKTKRWPMCIFNVLLNAIRINFWDFFKCSKTNNKPDKISSHFFKGIGTESHRRSFKKTPTKANFEEGYIRKYFYPQNRIPVDPPVSERRLQGRCGFCPIDKNWKSMTRSIKCKIPICLDQIKICQKCSKGYLILNYKVDL